MTKVRLKSVNDNWGGVIVIDLDRIGDNDTPGDSEYIREIASSIQTLNKLVILKSGEHKFETYANTVNVSDDCVSIIHYYTDSFTNQLCRHTHLLYFDGRHNVIIDNYSFASNA